MACCNIIVMATFLGVAITIYLLLNSKESSFVSPVVGLSLSIANVIYINVVSLFVCICFSLG